MSTNNFFLPPTVYRDSVKAIWQIDQQTTGFQESILPGGIVELIFNLGNPIKGSIGKDAGLLPRCFLNGFNTKPIQLDISGHHCFFGVRIQPMALPALLGIPAGEVANLLMDGALLNRSIEILWQQLAEENDFNNRVALLLYWVGMRALQAAPREQLLNGFLSDGAGQLWTVRTLASHACYSPRQLQRKLRSATGMNTEEILLYQKFQHSVKLLHHSTESLTGIAHSSGFYDQAHFIRSFRQFAGIPPGAYRSRKSRLPGHIHDNAAM
jgi:AraC-like DNA-binding protein